MLLVMNPFLSPRVQSRARGHFYPSTAVKPFSFLLVLLLSIVSAQAQVTSISFNGPEPPVRQSDTMRKITYGNATHRVFYSMTAYPSLTFPDVSLKGELLLLVGEKESCFMDYRQWQIDSAQEQATRELKSFSSIVNLDFTMPQPRFRTVLIKRRNRREGFINQSPSPEGRYLRYLDTGLRYEWKLEKGAQVVMGHVCRRATCHFRGRDYVAWYAQDIPIFEGPLCFNGLPGLILQVYDTQRHFTFTATRIEVVVGWMPVYLLDELVDEMGRAEARRIKRNARENPGVNSATGEQDSRPKAKRPASGVNPIELE